MRWYEEYPQPTSADKCPLCKSDTCRNAPTNRERERSLVLQISRQKMAEKALQGRPCDKGSSCEEVSEVDLRTAVAVRNTVKKLERDINDEIVAAFALPVSMG